VFLSIFDLNSVCAANNVHGEATVSQLFMRSVGLYGYKDFLGNHSLFRL
jgi:hypothetical protein